jgi:predicted  nucleic acid-binding Zn-ribbon protein
VYQAADLFRGIEDRVRATEMRADAAERAQFDIIGTTERKLKDASKALEEAQKRIVTQQDQLAALEFRAQVAETEAREAKQMLAQVEDAIRRRLLLPSEQADGRSSSVA